VKEEDWQRAGRCPAWFGPRRGRGSSWDGILREWGFWDLDLGAGNERRAGTGKTWDWRVRSGQEDARERRVSIDVAAAESQHFDFVF
jgi:hypothetical protein